MGPPPNLVSLALEQLQTQQIPASQVQEKMVVGKLMELKGIQLQQGLTETMALNMTLEQYRRRMGLDKNNSEGTPPTQAASPTTTVAQTALLLEAAEKYLKEKGLDGLDPEEFQAAVRAHAEGRPLPKATAAKTKVKKEKMPELLDNELVMVSSASEGEIQVVESNKGKAAASGNSGRPP